MKTLKQQLATVMSIKNEAACAKAFAEFCREHADEMPLPGEDPQFDKAMWAASAYVSLSKRDESIVNRVTSRLLGEKSESLAGGVMYLKDFIGNTKQAAINAWQDMLAAMAWQQMVPAGAMRGVGAQMVSLGTFQRQLADANIQVNLGWLLDQDNLRILLQAKDADQAAIPDVELRITECERGVVFSRKTNQDGAVVAPNVKVEPGTYQIQVMWKGEVAETPHFIV